MQELPTEDLCKTSPPAEKEASQAIVLNSFEPLVVFEQVYRTCLRMTNPRESDVGCRYPLKLFNMISTMYCILPIQFDRFMLRWCRQKYQRRQRPKTMQVSFWNFVTRPDLVASKSLDDWFEDDGIDFMCLVHRLNISQLHGQGRLSTVAWIIKDLESDFRQSKRLLCMARELRLSRGCYFDKYLFAMPPTLAVKMFFLMSGFGERTCILPMRQVQCSCRQIQVEAHRSSTTLSQLISFTGAWPRAT